MERILFKDTIAPVGIENLENFIRRLQILSDTGDKNTNQHTPIPGMLWASEPGINQTEILIQISEFLHKHDAVKFSGKCKFVEFVFNYCTRESDNPEFKRFVEKMQQAAGFKHEYKGILHIDISQWVGYEDETHFRTLLEYLRDYSNRWLIILSIITRERTETENIEHVISGYFGVDSIALKIPSTEQLIKYIEHRLKCRDLLLNNVSRTILFQSVEALRKSKTFDGFNALNKLCDDIIFEVYATGKSVKTVTKEIASKFSINSPYIDKAISKKENKRVIGFERGVE